MKVKKYEILKVLEDLSAQLSGKASKSVMLREDYIVAKNSKSFIEYAYVKLPFTVKKPFTVSIISLLSLLHGDGDTVDIEICDDHLSVTNGDDEEAIPIKLLHSVEEDFDLGSALKDSFSVRYVKLQHELKLNDSKRDSLIALYDSRGYPDLEENRVYGLKICNFFISKIMNKLQIVYRVFDETKDTHLLQDYIIGSEEYDDIIGELVPPSCDIGHLDIDALLHFYAEAEIEHDATGYPRINMDTLEVIQMASTLEDLGLR